MSMKTVISGTKPDGTETGDLAVEFVGAVIAGEVCVDVRVGDAAVLRVTLRELAAAVAAAEKAVPPPGWSLHGLYGPQGTFIAGQNLQPWPR